MDALTLLGSCYLTHGSSLIVLPSRDIQKFCAFHTGGAVGASSVLLIIPRDGGGGVGGASTEVDPCGAKKNPPHGVVVSIICNLQSVGLTKLALDIAREFDKELGSEGPLKIPITIYEC